MKRKRTTKVMTMSSELQAKTHSENGNSAKSGRRLLERRAVAKEKRVKVSRKADECDSKTAGPSKLQIEAMRRQLDSRRCERRL